MAGGLVLQIQLDYPSSEELPFWDEANAPVSDRFFALSINVVQTNESIVLAQSLNQKRSLVQPTHCKLLMSEWHVLKQDMIRETHVAFLTIIFHLIAVLENKEAFFFVMLDHLFCIVAKE